MLVELTEIYSEYKQVVENSKTVKKIFQIERTVYVNLNRITYLSKDDEDLTKIYFNDDYIKVKEPLDKVVELIKPIVNKPIINNYYENKK